MLTLSSTREEPLAAWRDSVAGAFDVAAISGDDAGCDYALIAFNTGRFILSDARSPPMRLTRSMYNIAQEPIDGFAIRVQLSGALAGRMGDHDVKCASGDVLFLDLLQTLELRVLAEEGGASDVMLWIPRAKMLAALVDERALHGFVMAGSSPTANLIVGSLRLLAQHAPNMTTPELDAFVDGLVHSITTAIAPRLEQASAANRARPQASFVTLRRYIDQNLRLPALNADYIAKTFGLSTASVYRLFEPVGGVAHYIRKTRLNRAYQDIVGSAFSHHRIGPIAYQLGFKNLSAFNRVFKETYGVSPGEARKNAERGIGVPTRAPAAGRDTLASWLAQICK